MYLFPWPEGGISVIRGNFISWLAKTEVLYCHYFRGWPVLGMYLLINLTCCPTPVGLAHGV